MARKTRKRHRWFRWLVFFVVTPIFVWSVAFFIWFFWRDIVKLIDKKGPSRMPAGISRGVEKSQPRRENRSREKIPEEDRRKLDEILKNR